MVCPKCGGGIVGYNDGTLKCVECTYVGRETAPPPAHVWQASVGGYLDTISLEEALTKV